jgi:hypothetical protein
MVKYIELLESIFLLIFMPLALLWSLDTIFNLNVEYSFWTWMASLFMFWFFRGHKEHDKRK